MTAYSPEILGVLNTSPESMVEESIATGDDEIRERGHHLIASGATWIDLGGRSITPDVPMIDDAEEQRRLRHALAILKAPESAPPPRISVDTWSADTGCFALEAGADAINYTGGPLPTSMLDAVAAQDAALFMTFMPYENAYVMRSAPRADVGTQAALDHLGPKVEAARAAGIKTLAIDPNLGIIHPTTDDHQKIHQQLEIVWNLDAFRTLDVPIFLYAARKPERLARIMMASAIVHARADFIRTHTPEMLVRLLADPQAETAAS
ncbi:MAG: dihydropteroate synthase [Myxococcota bacterium]